MIYLPKSRIYYFNQLVCEYYFYYAFKIQIIVLNNMVF